MSYDLAQLQELEPIWCDAPDLKRFCEERLAAGDSAPKIVSELASRCRRYAALQSSVGNEHDFMSLARQIYKDHKGVDFLRVFRARAGVSLSEAKDVLDNMS